jgi:hypothetical protein
MAGKKLTKLVRKVAILPAGLRPVINLANMLTTTKQRIPS